MITNKHGTNKHGTRKKNPKISGIFLYTLEKKMSSVEFEASQGLQKCVEAWKTKRHTKANLQPCFDLIFEELRKYNPIDTSPIPSSAETAKAQEEKDKAQTAQLHQAIWYLVVKMTEDDAKELTPGQLDKERRKLNDKFHLEIARDMNKAYRDMGISRRGGEQREQHLRQVAQARNIPLPTPDESLVDQMQDVNMNDSEDESEEEESEEKEETGRTINDDDFTTDDDDMDYEPSEDEGDDEDDEDEDEEEELDEEM